MEVSHKDVLPQSASAICKVTCFVVNGGGVFIERSIKAQAGCVSINVFFFLFTSVGKHALYAYSLRQSCFHSVMVAEKMHLVISCL